MLEMMTASAKVASGPGEAVFTTVGGQVFEVPAGVTKVSGVIITAGGGSGSSGVAAVYTGSGGGGSMLWFNDLPVEPGDKFSFAIPAGGAGGRVGGNNGASGSKVVLYLNGVMEVDLPSGSPSLGTSVTTDYYGGSGAAAPTIYAQRIYKYAQYALRPGGNGNQGGRTGSEPLGGRGPGYTASNIPTKGQSLYGIGGKDAIFGSGGNGSAPTTVQVPGNPGAQGAARFIWGEGRSFPYAAS